jgi:hypothetical protein
MSDRHPPTDAKPQTWLDLADDVLDEGVDREDRLSLTCEDLTVEIPATVGVDADRAVWHFDGAVRISVDGMRRPLAEWIHLWRSRSRNTPE